MDLDKLKKGADEVFVRLYEAMKTPEGLVHPQSYICCISALAGYACQYDVRAKYVVGEKLDEEKVFTVVMGKSGKKYFFGEMLNAPVVTEKYSVWALTGGALVHEKAPLIDLEEIFSYISKTVGGSEFGKVRNCRTGESILDYVKLMWKPFLPLAKNYCETGEYHILFGLALQKAMMLFKDAVDIHTQAVIAMESAISASKIELDKL